MSKDRTAQFLEQMGKGANVEASQLCPRRLHLPLPPVREIPRASRPPRKVKPAATRADLKHFGGYLDDETLEKIALLRIRLKMDNSALIKHAIEELHRKHNAKRAFGDV